MIDLDELLDAAAADVHRAVAQVPIPSRFVTEEFGIVARQSQRPRGTHRRSWIIAIAAVVVLVVGLVAIGTNRNDGSPGNDPSRLHWLMTDLPEGVQLVGVREPGDQAGADISTAMANVYATDAAPLGPLLSVRGDGGRPEWEIVPAATDLGTNFQETTIDGHRAAFADGATGTRLVFIELSGHWVLMTSRNIADAALSQMAQSVIRNEDGTAMVPAAALLDGLTLVLPSDAPIDDSALAVSFAAVGSATPDGRSIQLLVSTPRQYSPAVLGLEAELTPTKVVDADGFEGGYSMVSSVYPTDFRLLYWQRDGLVFVVTGFNVTAAEVMRAAESAAPASDTKWDEMLHQVGGGLDSGAVPEGTVPAGTVPAEPAPPGTDPPFTGDVRDVSVEVTVTDPSPNQQVWSGTLPTGEMWTVDVTRVFDSIAIRSKVDGLGQGMTYGPLVRPAGQELGCCGPISVVTADQAATALRVTTHTGERFAIPLHELPGSDGFRVAVVALPNVSGPQAAELIDEDGNVLESLPGG